MFTKSAHFYDAIYSFKDYKAEADMLRRLIRERVPGARTPLDVACGTGKHLVELNTDYEVEGLDLDPELLAIARTRLPSIPLHQGDTVSFRLHKSFDVVTCLFSSIGYALDTDHLERSIAAMAEHLNPGGILIVEPWFTPDAWQQGHLHALLVDEPELKVARMNRTEAAGHESRIEFHYLIGTPEGISYETEMHSLGLFTDDEYKRAFERASLDVEHDEEGLMGRGLFIGTPR